MKFVIRRTPVGFETYLFWDGALARVPEVLDLRAIPSQSPHPFLSRPMPLMPPRDTPILANVAYVISDERLLAIVH